MRFSRPCIYLVHQVSAGVPHALILQADAFLDFLLALCPPNIDPSSLSVMVAFAVGGLLGDVLFHLLPEIFLGEAEPDHARFVLVEPNRNLLLGVAIMVGFVTFVAMDKGLRIATGGEGGHDHGHSRATSSKEEKSTETSAVASGADPTIANGSLKSRKHSGDSSLIFSELEGLPSSILQKLWALKEPDRARRWLKETLEEDPNCGVMQVALWKAYEDAFHASEYPLLEAREFIQSAGNVLKGSSPEVIPGPKSRFIIKGVRPKTIRPSAANEQAPHTASSKSTASLPNHDEPSTSIRLSAYLNLIADFTHNITDGLAMSSSFYASPTLGATTAMAVFFHEIPHEVGDFALLIQSGFSKRKAMGAQFVTAVGAFLGTCIGIAVQELGRSGPSDSSGEFDSKGLAGTGLGWGDMLLPFTAGTFLYVGTVAVIPELLETGPNKRDESKKMITQFVAMAFGAGIMLA